MQLLHDSRSLSCREPYGAVPVGTRLTLRLEGDVPLGSRVLLRLWRDGETLVPMERDEAGRFAAEVELSGEPGLLWYYFRIETPQGVFFYGKAPTGGNGVLTREPDSWQVTVYRPQVLPAWYQNAVAYQIFPDRFARGSDWEMRQKNAAHPAGWKGTKRMVLQDWDDTPFYCKDSEHRVIRWPFFGGTLTGIREKLHYLRSLGVGVIYLNPIFLSPSNHKYDTSDYLTIDPGFGDEESFRELCAEAEKNGIRILLDGVFSHTGDDSIYFNRYGNYPEPGAFARTGSPYDSWYRFGEEHPAGYECWWGVDSLPNTEETDPGFQNLICGADGVIRKWLRLGASGWRLDVADELPDSFIRRIKSALLAEKPQGLLLGEVWEDASNKVSYDELRRYLLGEELDCTMHYPFRKAALDYLLGKTDPAEMAEALETIREHYPPSAFYGALNLIGTHDTRRALTVLGEAPEDLSEQEQEEYKLDAHHRYLGVQRLKLLQVLQFTSPGVPCVYYGDEAGMEGYADPFNRGPFPWGKEDGELMFHVRQLSHLRQEYPVLVSGDVAYGAEKNVFTMTRRQGDTEVRVYVNPDWKPAKAACPEREWLDILHGDVVSGPEVEIPPLGARVLLHEGGQEAFSTLPDAVRTPGGKGLLCPLFSLPGKGSVGTMGDALRFLDTVKAAGYESWMLLPLCPPGTGNSPYSSHCVFAGDPRLIDPDLPVEEKGLDSFLEENSWWLRDYALYRVLWAQYGGPWQSWPAAARNPKQREKLRKKYAKEIAKVEREQYSFFAQWDLVREKAKKLGIALIGDVPIYAAVDSAETWSQPGEFQLDEQGYPDCRAGCPPDYFSPDGQDWGNPLYNWPVMEADGYLWWKRRLRQAFRLYDYVRLDHFRSFAAYYSIPAGKTAKEGHWMKGAGVAFFRAMAAEFGSLPILAEDLGTLDDQVTVLLRHTGLPGMNVWQFSHHELPKMDKARLRTRVLFSGTHDNQTLRGFLEATGMDKKPEEVLEELLEMPAAAVILPVQDVLGLGDEARINVPGVPEGNWTWRMTMEQEREIAAGGVLK